LPKVALKTNMKLTGSKIRADFFFFIYICIKDTVELLVHQEYTLFSLFKKKIQMWY